MTRAAIFFLLVLLSGTSPVLVRAEQGQPLYTPVEEARVKVQEFDLDGDGDTDVTVPAALCNEGTFMPTVCWRSVPKTIKYRPKYEQCGGNAAILLSGPFSSAYSVVVRDRSNRDRFPPCVTRGSNYNGCSFYQCDTLGMNRCSAFKCQSTYVTGSGSKREKVCCLGDSGDSSVMSKATRMTIKLRDIPGSNLDPLVRLALRENNPRLKLN